jgi:VanZ family protein
MRPRYAAIAAAVAVIIAYGSLFPFEFHAGARPEGPLRYLLSTWNAGAGRIDLILNVILYLPLGFFTVQAVRGRPLSRLALATLLGIALSVSMEVTQFYDHGRVSEMTDVYANGAGALLGAIGGIAQRRWAPHQPFVVLMIGCWLGSRLFPYAPRPQAAPLGLLRHLVIWLVVALMLESLLGSGRARVAILALVPAVLGVRLLITGVVPDWQEIAGAALAALLWSALLFRLPLRAALVAACFVALVVEQALEPFTFQLPTRAFGLIPFRGFIFAPVETALRVFLEKSFTYGGLVWVIVRAGSPLGLATLASAALVLALRLVQLYLPGRSAEITDVVMVLLLAGMLRLLDSREDVTSPTS